MNLVERDAELSAVDDALVAAAERRGGGLVIEAEAGLGKTALVREAQVRAQKLGLVVLSASGAELEQTFSFGVVRQLFEPVFRRASAQERSSFLRGVAGTLAWMVLPGETDEHHVAEDG